MDAFCHNYLKDWRVPLTLAGLAATAYATHKLLVTGSKCSARPQYKRDVVILHQFQRANYTPSLSPYPIKLETYLRLAKIPYENDFKNAIGPKGKSPWITYNDEDVADSDLCIQYLNQKFALDLNDHLMEEEKATAHAFQVMLDEYLVWCSRVFRYVFDENAPATLTKTGGFGSSPGIPFWWTVAEYQKIAKRNAIAQGMGRFSKEEVELIADRILQSVSVFLGTKPYLMGNKISEVDCSLFGALTQLLWNSPGTKMESQLTGKYTNLREYTMRLKREIWPDWNLSFPMKT